MQNEIGRRNIEAHRQGQIELGRERKASALLGALQTACHGALPAIETVERLDDAGWAALEQLAGTRPASADTRAVVVRRLKGLHQMQRRMADPFSSFQDARSA